MKIKRNSNWLEDEKLFNDPTTTQQSTLLKREQIDKIEEFPIKENNKVIIAYQHLSLFVFFDDIKTKKKAEDKIVKKNSEK